MVQIMARVGAQIVMWGSVLFSTLALAILLVQVLAIAAPSLGEEGIFRATFVSCLCWVIYLCMWTPQQPLQVLVRCFLLSLLAAVIAIIVLLFS